MTTDVVRIEVPDGDAGDLANELAQVDDVVAASTERTRSLGAALVLVQVVGGALGDVATAVPIVQKVVEMIRGKGVKGATIELPNGTKVAVDSASVEDIERLLEAARA